MRYCLAYRYVESVESDEVQVFSTGDCIISKHAAA